MSLVNNTLNFSTPRDRRYTKPSAKTLRINTWETSEGTAVLGTQQSAVTNASSGASVSITDNTGGVVGSTTETIPSGGAPGPATNILDSLGDIMDRNFKGLGSQINKSVGDVADIRSQLNELLAAARSFGMIDS